MPIRILVLSNLYPPHAVGGYERMCRDVVQRLRRRGHEVAVLTTRFRVEGSTADEDEEQGVHRQLGFYWDGREIVCPPLWRQVLLEGGNRRCLGRLLDAFAPDVVSVWGMGGLSLGLLAVPARRRIPLLYVVGDDWLVYGSWADCWMRRFAGRDAVASLVALATRLPTRPPDIGATGAFCFVSEFIRRRAEEVGGGTFPTATVTYAGIDRDDFPPAMDPQSERPWRWRLLCVGRLTEQKGLETAVRALASLTAEATLEIVGSGDREYGRQLEALAASLGVGARVRLLAPMERSRLRDRYLGADALLFTSIGPEAFGLVALEALACGTPVVATCVGGSAEFLFDGINCLRFSPGDPVGLVEAVGTLASDPVLRARLVAAGLRTANELTIERLSDALEEWHDAAAARFASGRPSRRPPLRPGLVS